MKKIFIAIILFTGVINIRYAQESTKAFKPNGKVHFKVFWNYHADLSNNATKTSAFELKRSYFGYKYAFSKDITAKITFDVGSDTGGSAYTAFLKAAQLDWKVASGVKLSMGLIGLKQFNDQEHFWGYRYLFKSFQDQNGFGSSADLGVNAEFTLAKNLKANFLIINGEGYKKIQDTDGNQKIGGSLVYNDKSFTAKFYLDNQPTTGGDAITSYAFFAGYKGDSFRLGAEYNLQNNATKYASPATGKDLNGVSIYSTYKLNKKWDMFARFDQLGSNKLAGDTQDWNYDKNGSKIILGFQVAPVKGLKFALNYQGFTSDNSALDTQSLVFLNAEFKL